MKISAAILGVLLITSANLRAAELGAADFAPTADHPIGWRGDWTGRYPGATPPTQWNRHVKGITSEIKYQAKKPAGEPGKEAATLEYFTIKDWLVAGPFDMADPKADFEKDFVGGEAAITPNEGDKAGTGTVAWKSVHVGMDNQTTHIHNGGMCGNLNIDYVYLFGKFKIDEKTGNFSIESDLPNKVAYAHTYIHSPTGGKVSLVDLNWGAAAKAWLNGKPVPVVVETNQNVWNKKDIDVTLAPGWNSLTIKVASGDVAFKEGGEAISRWRSAVYIKPAGPISYETKNITWMTRVTGRSMSQPAIVGDKLFFGSNISDLMCVSKTDGKILWIHSNTPWDALSPEDKSTFKDKIEPLVTQLEKMNDDVATAINAMVSPQGMSSDQQAVIDKKLKEKSDFEGKIHKEFEGIDKKRFPPLYGNEVASSNAAPCTDGARIYWACGGGMKGSGASVVCCFDPSGKRVWSYHEAFGAAEHGLHTSPFLAEGKLIYGAASWLVAFDAPTGKIVWKNKCDEFCGSSPQLVKIGNEQAILYKQHSTLCRVSTGVKFAGNDFFGFGDETPVVDNGIMYMPDRFKGWSTANVAFTAVQLPTAIADKAAVKQLYELKWSENHVQLRGISYWVASPLALDGLIYTLDMSGGLMIVDTKAQKTVYRGWLDWYCRYNRYLYGAVASPTVGGKNIYFVDNAGYTIILKPGPAYQEVGRNAIENISPSSNSGNPCKVEAFYTNPVFCGDTIFLKGEEYLYAIKGK